MNAKCKCFQSNSAVTPIFFIVTEPSLFPIHGLNPLSVELLVEAVETVNVTLSLSGDGTELESDLAINDTLAESDQAGDTNVLERVLNTGNEVGNELGDGSTVEDGTRDTLGDKEVVALGEVAGGTGVGSLGVVGVGRTNTSLLVRHGVDGTHTSVGLDELTLARDVRLTGRLGGTGKETSHHDGAGTKSETLDDVANVLDTTVSNAGNTEAGSERGDAVDGSSLRTADSHDLLGDAGRAGAHTDSETVNTSGDETSSLLAGDDVATNDIEAGVGLLDVLDHLDLVHGVTLGRVEDDNVETGINELLETGLVVGTGTNGGSGDQLLGLGELGGKRVVQVLHQIGARDERDEVAAVVDDGELALLGLLQDGVGLGELNAALSGDELGGHDLADRVSQVVVELDVTGSDDTEELGAKLAGLCKNHVSRAVLIESSDKNMGFCVFFRFQNISPQQIDLNAVERKLLYLLSHPQTGRERKEMLAYQ
jgi:hypothetical protein